MKLFLLISLKIGEESYLKMMENSLMICSM